MPLYLEPVSAAEDNASVIAIRQYGVGYKVYSLASHWPFVIVAVRAAMKRAFLCMGISIIVLLVSLMYHTCAAFDRCAGFKLETLRTADHLTAPLIIYVITWQVLQGLGTRTTKTRMLSFLAIAVAVDIIILALALFVHPFDLVPAYIILIGAVPSTMGVFFALFRVDRTDKDDVEHDRLNGPMLFGALAFMAAAILFFMLTDPSSFLHSWWHTFAGIAVLFVLEGTTWTPPAAVTAKTTIV